MFKRLAGRMSYISGDFSDERLYKRLAKARGDVEHPLFYLEIPPNLFAPVVEQLGKAGLTKGAKVAVEKPFGTTWPRRASSTPT